MHYAMLLVTAAPHLHTWHAQSGVLPQPSHTAAAMHLYSLSGYRLS